MSSRRRRSLEDALDSAVLVDASVGADPGGQRRVIGARLGDELIAASIDVVEAWHEIDAAHERLGRAVAALEHLVGRQR